MREIVRRCQHSGIELWMKLQDFWDRLTPTSRRTLSNAVGGPFMKKTPEEIFTILDELSEDANQWLSDSVERRQSTGVHQVDATISAQVQLDAMAKEIRKLTVALMQNVYHASCDICGRGHPTHKCQASTEEVNVVGNYNFNAMCQRHPSFSWSSPGGTANAWQQNNPRFQEQGAPGFQNQQRQQYQSPQSNQPSMEDLMKTFIIKMDERLDAHDAAIKEFGTSFRSLERQVGHLATLMSERAPGTLLADTEGNPKEIVNTVTLRSGQMLKDLTPIHKHVRHEKERGEQLKIGVEKKKEENSRREEPEASKYMHVLPFPQKLSREKLDKQFERFLDILKQGIVEDVLVRVDKFVFHVDFIVVNMEENKEAPLILGRPFLATGRAILDIHDRKLMLRVGEKTVTFEMDVETEVKREKLGDSVVWKVKGVTEKAAGSEKNKYGVYPKKAEKKLSAWMSALVRARGMEPNFDSNPD
ncbi:uncharacterized protein [Nicotiana tomentosiformis]|uniref:uncharacterized protein n=1 Tax=Nicotiana tomentosiformis TaxID=4098 RepID=UPI00388CA5FC